MSEPPAGGGECPWRWSRSARLTGVAATSIRTSPGPTTASGTSTCSRTSGPPGARATAAFTQSSFVLVAGVVHDAVVGNVVVDVVGDRRVGRVVPLLGQGLGLGGES